MLKYKICHMVVKTKFSITLMMHPSSTWGITSNQSFLLPWMKLHGASGFSSNKKERTEECNNEKETASINILSYLAIASTLGYCQNLKYLELALNLWLLYLLVKFNFIMARHFEEIRRQHQHNRNRLKIFFPLVISNF